MPDPVFQHGRVIRLSARVNHDEQRVDQAGRREAGDAERGARESALWALKSPN